MVPRGGEHSGIPPEGIIFTGDQEKRGEKSMAIYTGSHFPQEAYQKRRGKGIKH